MRRGVQRAAEHTVDGVKALHAADVKDWWALVFRLVEQPDAAAAIFRAHEPDGAGLCKVCVDVRTDDARNMPWPCPTQAMAENALILRAQRDRTDRGDNRPLR